MNRLLFNNGQGNEEFANLPRKINVCISPTRDDFPHTQVWCCRQRHCSISQNKIDRGQTLLHVCIR